MIPSTMNEALINTNEQSGKVSVAALQAASGDNRKFASMLADLLDSQVNRLHRRVGLVPNYFMTRGEAIPQEEVFQSFTAFSRKTTEKTFKLFHQKDFREEALYAEFEDTLKTVHDVVTKNQQATKLLSGEVSSVLNRPVFKDGDSLLQILVKRRHLRFVRTLLLYAGDLLDLDQRNRKGYSAMDLAFDRLEVEIIYLLLLHGATVSPRCTTRSSLGHTEWTVYDMLLNLDTGRWLHKQSEKEIMRQAQSTITEELHNDLIQWTNGGVMSDNVIQQLGRMPRLFTIVLADGCDAITNHEAWASMIRHLTFLRHKKASTDVSQNDNTEVKFSDDSFHSVSEATPCNDLCGYLKEFVPDTSKFRTAGRTVFFQSHNGGEIAIKLSKTSEYTRTPHPLAKEAVMNERIANWKQDYGLQSDYPETIQLLLLSHVPKDIRQSIESQQASGFHPFSVSSNVGGGVMALVYSPPKGYGLYANDPTLPLDACLGGIAKAGYDAAVLARHGLYHGALVDIQHDASTSDQRPHLWSFESFLTRFRGGAGRIEGGFAGLAAPNVRVSGLADLKHVLTRDEVISRYDPSVIHAQHNILYNDQEREVVSEMEQVGASLFATALLVSSSWQSRHKMGVADAENLNLPLELYSCFATFLRGYLQIDQHQADTFLHLVGTDFWLMAAQIKLFSTPNYVAIAETAPRRPVFGVLAKTFGRLTHPTAFRHFSQRGSMDLGNKPGKSLSEIKKVYKQVSGQCDYPRVDTSMMRCSPTWVKGHGWTDPNNFGRAHFGSYEGVLPFQQLIRDLYTVVYLAGLARRHGGFQVFLNNDSA